uniref:Uncharacterized protein n=1 Tax=Ditylenchus dipsaci TaxID=166011 RepID=A0A915D2X1_9BILA
MVHPVCQKKSEYVLEPTVNNGDALREQDLAHLSLLEALEQLPNKVHLKHNFSGQNFNSNCRSRQSSEPGLRQQQQDKKLAKLRLAYSKRQKKLKKQLDSSFDSVDSMAYPSNDEDQKLSCKEVCFGKRAKKWAFWFIVAFLAALTVKDVIALVNKLKYLPVHPNPKQSDMNIMFNESMTMPNITFCMSRSQAWSHFRINSSESTEEWDAHIQDQLMNMTDKKAFLSSPWDYRMVMELYNLISSLTSMERETTLEGSASTIQKFGKQERFSTLRKNLKMWIDVIKDLDISLRSSPRRSEKKH